MKDWETAKLFHDTYERLAPQFGYETRQDTKEFDSNSPNGKLMIAVCNEVKEKWLLQIEEIVGEDEFPEFKMDSAFEYNAEMLRFIGRNEEKRRIKIEINKLKE